METTKEKVARALAARVQDGEIIGLGSGSTVELAVERIGERIAKEGLRVTGMPSSQRIARVAADAGITVISPFVDLRPAWGFDGADEVDPLLNLIKGRGGAMLPEKILAKKVTKFVIIVSEDKLVSVLGSKFPVPVEIIPESLSIVKEQLLAMGASEIVVRESSGKYGPVITEHGNIILDVRFESLKATFEKEIKGIVGVVESGLFCGYSPEVIIAGADRVLSRTLDAKGKVAEKPLFL